MRVSTLAIHAQRQRSAMDMIIAPIVLTSIVLTIVLVILYLIKENSTAAARQQTSSDTIRLEPIPEDDGELDPQTRKFLHRKHLTDEPGRSAINWKRKRCSKVTRPTRMERSQGCRRSSTIGKSEAVFHG